MSRRARERMGPRAAKAWHMGDDLPPIAVAPQRRPPVGSSIGNWVEPLLPEWEMRVVRLLAEKGDVWHGDATRGGLFTGRIAGQLRMTPHTPERDALGTTLSTLRGRGLVHFEYVHGVDREGRWWVTPEGVEVARS